MTKFDELLALNEKLDAVLVDMNKANKHLENELKSKRNAAQEQMFNDIAVFRGYMIKVGMRSVVLNTGINPTYKDGIVAALTVDTSTTSIGLRTMYINKPTDYAFHRWFEKDIPIADAKTNWTNEYSKDYMFKIMKHWDIAYKNMKNDLFDKIKEFMAEKASKVTERQSELVNQLDDFCRKE